MFLKENITFTFATSLNLKQISMKNLIKKTVLIVVMTFTLLSNANEGLSFIEKDGKIKTVLKLDHVKPGHLLSIIDINGLIMYKEHIRESGVYNKSFDLTALPNGDYFFEIDKGVAIKRIPFNVNLSSVAFNKEKESTVYKPIVRIKENLLFISRLSLQKEPLEIKVYYYESEFYKFNLIYDEIVKDTKILNRIYALDSNKKGNYELVFKSTDRLFIEKVKL